MQGFFESIPKWVEWLLALLGGGGASGFGVHKWYQSKIKADRLDFEEKADYRDVLREDLENLRKRQEQYEVELAESRSKYFEMQEKYHELKLEHAETVRENKLMRREIRELREEISKLREQLNS